MGLFGERLHKEIDYMKKAFLLFSTLFGLCASALATGTFYHPPTFSTSTGKATMGIVGDFRVETDTTTNNLAFVLSSSSGIYSSTNVNTGFNLATGTLYNWLHVASVTVYNTLTTTGNIYAGNYFGNGSNLTGITAPIGTLPGGSTSYAQFTNVANSTNAIYTRLDLLGQSTTFLNLSSQTLLTSVTNLNLSTANITNRENANALSTTSFYTRLESVAVSTTALNLSSQTLLTLIGNLNASTLTLTTNFNASTANITNRANSVAISTTALDLSTRTLLTFINNLNVSTANLTISNSIMGGATSYLKTLILAISPTTGTIVASSGTFYGTVTSTSGFIGGNSTFTYLFGNGQYLTGILAGINTASTNTFSAAQTFTSITVLAPSNFISAVSIGSATVYGTLTSTNTAYLSNLLVNTLGSLSASSIAFTSMGSWDNYLTTSALVLKSPIQNASYVDMIDFQSYGSASNLQGDYRLRMREGGGVYNLEMYTDNPLFGGMNVYWGVSRAYNAAPSGALFSIYAPLSISSSITQTGGLASFQNTSVASVTVYNTLTTTNSIFAKSYFGDGSNLSGILSNSTIVKSTNNFSQPNVFGATTTFSSATYIIAALFVDSLTVRGTITTTGAVIANTYYGDASHLTGIPGVSGGAPSLATYVDNQTKVLISSINFVSTDFNRTNAGSSITVTVGSLSGHYLGIDHLDVSNTVGTAAVTISDNNVGNKQALRVIQNNSANDAYALWVNYVGDNKFLTFGNHGKLAIGDDVALNATSQLEVIDGDLRVRGTGAAITLNNGDLTLNGGNIFDRGGYVYVASMTSIGTITSTNGFVGDGSKLYNLSARVSFNVSVDSNNFISVATMNLVSHDFATAFTGSTMTLMLSTNVARTDGSATSVPYSILGSNPIVAFDINAQAERWVGARNQNASGCVGYALVTNETNGLSRITSCGGAASAYPSDLIISYGKDDGAGGILFTNAGNGTFSANNPKAFFINPSSFTVGIGTMTPTSTLTMSATSSLVTPNFGMRILDYKGNVGFSVGLDSAIVRNILWVGSMTAYGTITSSSGFYGDGSHLTGVTASAAQSLPLIANATNYINNGDVLQKGATFYVSSGTISTLIYIASANLSGALTTIAAINMNNANLNIGNGNIEMGGTFGVIVANPGWNNNGIKFGPDDTSFTGFQGFRSTVAFISYDPAIPGQSGEVGRFTNKFWTFFSSFSNSALVNIGTVSSNGSQNIDLFTISSRTISAAQFWKTFNFNSSSFTSLVPVVVASSLSVSGTLNADGGFYGDGSHLSGISSFNQNLLYNFLQPQYFSSSMTVVANSTFSAQLTVGSMTVYGSITTTSPVSASTYWGDGSHLTGLSAFGQGSSYNFTAPQVFNASFTVNNTSTFTGTMFVASMTVYGMITSSTGFAGNGSKLTGISASAVQTLPLIAGDTGYFVTYGSQTITGAPTFTSTVTFLNNSTFTATVRVGSMTVYGSVTSTTGFFGNGAGLTGITAVTVQSIPLIAGDTGYMAVYATRTISASETFNSSVTITQNVSIASMTISSGITNNSAYNQVVSSIAVSSSTAFIGYITDCRLSNNFRLTVASDTTNAVAGSNRANFTLFNPTAPVDGQVVTWEIVQPASNLSTATVTLGDKFVFGVDITTCVLSGTANTTDFLTAAYNAFKDKWRVRGFIRGY
jgi:hypothetical protein